VAGLEGRQRAVAARGAALRGGARLQQGGHFPPFVAVAILGLVLVGCSARGVGTWPAAPTDERCEHAQMVRGQVEPGAQEVVVRPKKKAWEATFGGEEAARPHVRARLAGWPGRLLAPRPRRDETDREFMTRLAGDTWRGLSAFVDRDSRLPIDNVRLGADPRVGDYTNITTVGLRMIAIVAARELTLVSDAEAVAELRALFGTLDRLERHAGFFFNYYDTTSLERSSNLVSFVDSSWLTAGLVVVRATFPELGATATRLIRAQDYRFFYDGTVQRMSHGYYVHHASRSLFHYGVFYAESRLGSLIAIGKGDVPEAHWFRMVRTFPPACRWQAGQPVGRRPKDVRGHASALTLAVTPAEAVANLRRLAERYDINGDFGLYDAVDPVSGEVAHAYLALDQSMILIAAANYLKDGVVQRRFAADPIVARVLPLLAAENFFD
jgi:hypothetical protein